MAAGTELAAAYVSLTISANQIAPQVNKQLGAVEKQADKSGKAAGSKFSSGMGGAFKGLAGMFAGAMAGLAVKNFLGDALAEARESQKVGALTASIIKSTGGAAKISAGQIGSLADSISRKTGVDDEAIQTGANLLLTFKNVRNEAGKGSDVFNRATAAALDLSKAGFGSVDGAAKMLGKALNDPIKGITALGRAGVTFTDEQKKQIKTLTESGNVLGAQKIIMAEVESQVGGAAAATATAGEKARVTFDNLKESAGTYLLPIVDDLATKFTELVDGFQKGEGAGGKIAVAFGAVKGVFLEVVGGVTAFTAAWKYNDGEVTSSGFPGMMERLGYAARQTFDYFTGTVMPFMVKYQNVLIPVGAGILAIVAALKIWRIATMAYTAVQAALNVVMTANPIGLVVLAIVGLIAAFVVAYKKSETFRAIVDAAWAGIKVAVSAVVNWFRNTAWPWMRDAFQWIGDKAKWLWDKIKMAWDGIRSGVSTAWAWVKANVIDRMVAAFQWVSEKATAFKDANVRAFNLLRDGLAAGWNWIRTNVFDKFKAGLDLLKDKFGTVVSAIGTAWDKIKEIAAKPIRFVINTVVNGLIKGFNKLSGAVGGPTISEISAGFASGGVLPGYTPGRDVHQFYSPTGGRLALSGGEAIMRPEFARLVGGKAGVDRLNAMARAGNVPMQAFAGGGVVNWIKSKGSGALDWALKKAGAVWDAMKDPAKYLLDKLPSIPGGSALAGMGGAVKDKLVGLAAAKVKELFSSFSSALSQEQAAKAASSVGGMYSGKGGGGNALNRVRGMLIPGTQVTSTYRSPGRNAAVGGSRTSYHMDARNPAVDIGGATAALDRLYPILRAAGGWRELIWRAPGHYDHIHAAKDGGVLPKPLLFDRGGILPMGTSLVRNDTGAPEPLARVGHDSGRREPLVVNLVLPDGRVLTSAVIDDLGGRR